MKVKDDPRLAGMVKESLGYINKMERMISEAELERDDTEEYAMAASTVRGRK